MGAEVAFKLIDQRIFEHTNKRLNDLEKQVFIGSWNGKTYSEIYPANPAYVEKSVGYKLWHKLSAVLGERVTKKQLKSAIVRSLATASTSQKVLICYQSQLHQHPLPQQLSQALIQQGHQVSIASEIKSISLASADLWQHLATFLDTAELSHRWDYLVLVALPAPADA